MKKIIIYNASQYTKTGKLKKNARSEMGLTIVGSETKDKEHDNNYVAKTIKERGYHSFVSPYIFTHIEAKNASGERVVIKEMVTIGRDNVEVSTSPITLYKLLTK